MYKERKSTSEIKAKARRTLNRHISKKTKTYVFDTSAVINKFLRRLLKKGMQGKLIIPNAVVAELENLANKGFEEGFIGLDEIAKLHKLKKFYKIKIYFYGLRPKEHHIKYAKRGEIDALIREIAFKSHAVLVTADLVQAKSAQAYGIKVLFLRPKIQKPKKKSFFLFRK